VDRDITLDTIREAAANVYQVARRTPLIALDFTGNSSTQTGTSIHLKLETLQPTGSFKIRGAYNAVRQLAPRELAHGVWTVSAGNAALGVALAARSVGASCSVLIADSAQQTKLDGIERLGAAVIPVSYNECWRVVAERDAERLPGIFIPPFDDDAFMSGNGTIGLEIIEDLPQVETVIASVGGGGLLVGVAAAMKALKPSVRVIAVEPESAAPLHRSFARGKASRFDGWQASFVDGAGGQSVTKTMWPLLRDLVDESIVVSHDAVREAMRILAIHAHLIAEGAGACALAAALTGRAGNGPIAAIISGGNIDLAVFTEIVTHPTTRR